MILNKLFSRLSIFSLVVGSIVMLSSCSTNTPHDEFLDSQLLFDRNSKYYSLALQAMAEQMEGEPSSPENSWRQILIKANESGDQDDLTSARYHLAQLYKQWGKYDQAIPLYADFVEAKRKQSKEAYPQLADNLKELGDMHFNAGRYVKAKELYEEALTNWGESKQNPETLETLHQLALCSDKAKDWPATKSFFDQAIANHHKLMQMPDLKERKYYIELLSAMTMDDYGNLLSQKGMLAEADIIKQQARKLWLELAKATNVKLELELESQINVPTKTEIIKALAEYYCTQGQYELAANLYDRWYELSEALAKSEYDEGRHQSESIRELWRLKRKCFNTIGNLK